MMFIRKFPIFPKSCIVPTLPAVPSRTNIQKNPRQRLFDAFWSFLNFLREHPSPSLKNNQFMINSWLIHGNLWRHPPAQSLK